jgi:hypothetical protein
MSLPEQLKKQTEAISEYYRKAAESAANPGASEGQTPTEQGTSQPADESQPAAVQPQTNEQPSVGDNDSENENSETFAQRWRSLQGSYNAQVRANREMQQRLQNMEQLLASMSSQSAQPAKTTPQAESVVQRLVSEKDVEEYGDSIDVMRKVTREELHEVASRIARIEAALQQMQSQVVPQVQAVAKRQAVTAEQQFWTDLTGAVANWREINGNAAFQEWLLQADPLTGITRQTYLEDAQGALDANRVANIFRTWLANTGQASAAQKPTRSAASELERQVAPGRSKAAQAPASNKAKTYTPEDIRTFFNDVRSGKYKGREQERDRIERDIFAAQHDNRIVNA